MQWQSVGERALSGSMQQMTAKKQRELGSAGFRAYPNVAHAWGLSESQAARLLGTPESTYRRWKRQPERANLDVNHLERLSLILGIYKKLHILLPREDAADTWLKRPNASPVFQQQRPLDRMLAGHIADLVAVRRHLDGACGW